MTRQRMLSVAAALLMLQLAACATLRQWFVDVTPQTVEEGVASGFVTLTALNRSFTSLVQGKVLNRADAERISASLDVAGRDLHKAKDLLDTSQLTAADSYLKLSNGILDMVESELTAAGGTVP